MTIYIYALKDPFTDEIRYIGKSVRPKERLTNQCNEHSDTYRCHWIQSVIKQGKKPVQIILEELLPDSDWQKSEREWIAYGRSQGWPLTNTTDGGDGVPGLSGESKERMLKTWLGRKHKPESLLKIGSASKGRKHTPEWSMLMHEKMKGREFSADTRSKISASVSKLTDTQVQEILELLKQKISQYVIADRYGVHQTTISNINCGKFYRK